MSGLVCPKCGTLFVGRNKDEDQLRTRIAALETENERLRKGLRLIIERPPGQAHRIAIQMFGTERSPK